MTVRIVTRRPPPWRRYSALAAVESEIAVGTGESAAPGFGAPSGIVFPGSAVLSYISDPDQTTHFVINQEVSGTTVPNLAAGWTVLYRQKPYAQQDSFWIGPFHVAYNTNWDTASAMHYAGVGYPYPRGEEGNPDANCFEISIGQGDIYSWEQGGFADVPAYNAEYRTVAKIELVSGEIQVRVWPMWRNASNKGNSLYGVVSNGAVSHPSAAERCWLWGDARWNMGNERYNGLLSHPSLYTAEDGSVLTDEEVDLAWADPLDPAVADRCWYTNPSPSSVEDYTDKSGNGHDPVLVIGDEAPSLSVASF